MPKNNETSGPFTLLDKNKFEKALKEHTHIYHGGARCATDTVGHPTPDNRSAEDLVVHAAQGFIPLWQKGVTLHWRIQERSLLQFADPEAAKNYVRELFGEALLAWDAAVPVRFVESHQPWDFEFVLSSVDDCDPGGCTLASAFFPDAGQHELQLYPLMFRRSRAEQIETMAHELGHVFGLRHFFAKTREAILPSELYGEHNPISIMNYGENSQLTDTDKSDMIALYDQVWSGELVHINGTPIQLVEPFSAHYVSAPPPAALLARKIDSIAARRST